MAVQNDVIAKGVRFLFEKGCQKMIKADGNKKQPQLYVISGWPKQVRIWVHERLSRVCTNAGINR